MAIEIKPRLLICGASAYPRRIDFMRFRQIVDNVNLAIFNEINYKLTNKKGYTPEDIITEYESKKCYLMADMAHIAGLVAAKLHQNPISYCDIVTSTTHKTLRGTRGGIILTDKKDIIEKINKAVFPGVQGGPLEHIIAAKAVCFGEALKPEFIEYQQQVVSNARTLATQLIDNKINVVSGGTDNHIVLLDLRGTNITGLELEQRLHSVGITTNKNAIPFDNQKKTITSGVRLGTPALTTRGMKEDEMIIIANLITMAIKDFENQKEYIKEQVGILCKDFPLKV